MYVSFINKKNLYLLRRRDRQCVYPLKLATTESQHSFENRNIFLGCLCLPRSLHEVAENASMRSERSYWEPNSMGTLKINGTRNHAMRRMPESAPHSDCATASVPIPPERFHWYLHNFLVLDIHAIERKTI